MKALALEGMKIDLEIRKKLINLLNLKNKLEELKKTESNPIQQKEIEDNLLAIEELIGKIRYISLDYLNILSKPEKEEDVI